ncbi:Flavodoxin [Selenomonas sp. WCT3]|uniref:flavodoxin family protein n=1 Tax=Selenomonas sp. WCT3 TaxID=3158785 RepID=UPI000889FE1F|nr:Flavodoxin [Selenomonas ruminantium]
MKLLVVYSSKTGNTKKVAMAIGETLGVEPVAVTDAPSPDDYDWIVAGFWVDKGTADAAMKAYLSKITNKQVALFATLGAEPDSDHARQCLANAAKLLGPGCTLTGQFICQGKVSDEMVSMMKKMFPEGHPHAMTAERLARIEKAASHPDAEDLSAAQAYFADWRKEWIAG